MDASLGSPTLTMPGEPAGDWEHLKHVLVSGRFAGSMAHDARIASLCLAHGVRELWSADRDLGRFNSSLDSQSVDRLSQIR